MKLIQLNLLLFAAFSINASYVDFESINRQLQERDLQNNICASIINSVDIFEGCGCEFQFLRNTAEVNCDNKCQGCERNQDVCVAGSFTAFIAVAGAQLQRIIFRVEHSGNDSSKRTLSLELTEGSASCNTFINNVKCSSCTLASPNIDFTADCIDAVHDCRNIGFGQVNGCDIAALQALPPTNPFSALASNVVYPLEACLAQSPTAPAPIRAPIPAPAPIRQPVPSPVRQPVPSPVRQPVPAPTPVRPPAPVRPPVRPPAPTLSGIPPKKPVPDNKDKDQLKLSNFDVGRGGLNRKLKSARGE